MARRTVEIISSNLHGEEIRYPLRGAHPILPLGRYVDTVRMQQILQCHMRVRCLLLALLCGVLLAPVSNLFAQVDLKLARHRTATTLSVEKMFFSQDDCSVAEGCV